MKQLHSSFSWQPFYTELAQKLAQYVDRQRDLVNFLSGLRARGLTVTQLDDRDEAGQRFLLREIDPFTLFAVFNRQIKEDSRTRILKEMRKFFDVQSAIPRDFVGIPVVNNQRSWFFAYAESRRPDDIPKLWRLFAMALKPEPMKSDGFGEAFDQALDVRGVNVNLTMGLFWIRPDVFVSLDSVMREYASIKLPPSGLRFDSYMEILNDVRRRFKVPLHELSHPEAEGGVAQTD